MDQHDDEWAPRETPMSPEAAQAFLFEHREQWAPGGPPPARSGAGPLNDADLSGRSDEIREGEARAFGPFDGSRDQSLRRAPATAVSTPIGTPARTTATRRWRGARNAYLNAAGDRIVCASHGAEFEIETGRCVLGAALGQSLDPAPIEVDGGRRNRLQIAKKNREERMSMSGQGLKVLIIGGGFSGMSAAIQLRKARRGASISSRSIPAGAPMAPASAFGGATLRAFRTLGILDEFLKRGAGTDGVDLFTSSGHPIGDPADAAARAARMCPAQGAIMRPVLAAILAQGDARRREPAVRLGTTFTRIDNAADGVEVRLSDGSRGRLRPRHRRRRP